VDAVAILNLLAYLSISMTFLSVEASSGAMDACIKCMINTTACSKVD
jgi:hypothetical protein